MAVYKSKDTFRVKPWCSDTYKGSTRHKKYFATEGEAKIYDAQQTLSPISKKGWDKIKVSSLLERYRDEIVPTLAGYKGDKDNTTYRLNQMLTKTRPGKLLCGYSLSDLVERVQGWEYVRLRQKQVSMPTVSKERNILQRVFATAIEEWGYIGLTNPFKDLTLKGSKRRRNRRLEDGEYEKLIEASNTRRGINKRYVVLAIDIAIETGMREQEVFNLEWRDVNFDIRVITIRKSMMDYKQEVAGRRISLPYRTMVDLVCLKEDIEYYNKIEIKKTERIFPMTQRALIQTFERVVEEAEIEGLVYADLRREANSRWGELEPFLSDTQRKTMLGHLNSSNNINDTYSNPKLREITKILDKQCTGMTFEEKYRESLEKGRSVYDIIKEMYWFEIPTRKELDDWMKIAEQKPSEETKKSDSWKQLAFMSELQKAGILPTPDRNLDIDKYTEDGKLYNEFGQQCEIYRHRLQQISTNPTYEQLDKIKAIHRKVYGHWEK